MKSLRLLPLFGLLAFAALFVRNCPPSAEANPLFLLAGTTQSSSSSSSSSSGGGAPTYYAKTESTDASTVGITLAADLTNGVIVATSFAELSGADLTATFNGSSMSAAHTSAGASGRTSQTFVLAVGNLTAGSYDVVFTGGAYSRSVIVTAYNNVNQTTPTGTGAVTTFNYNGATGGVTPASAVGDTVVCIASRADALPTSLGAGQTVRGTASNGAGEYVNLSDKAGAASTTAVEVTYAADGAYVVSGFALKAL